MTLPEAIGILVFGTLCATWAWAMGRRHERDRKKWPFNQDIY